MELLSTTGDYYFQKILGAEYDLIWISTPTDWMVRRPGKRTTTHWKRIQTWLTRAVRLRIKVILCGPTGYFWKIPNIIESINTLKLSKLNLRLCHFGLKYDAKDQRPSATCIQLATNIEHPKIDWNCKCKIPYEKHVKDWYGQTPEHAEWRRATTQSFIKTITQTILHDKCQIHRPTKTVLHVEGSMNPQTDDESGDASDDSTSEKLHPQDEVILDNSTSSLPIDPPLFDSTTHSYYPSMTKKVQTTTTLPTEARLKQKERLKMLKEKRIKPANRK